MGKHEIINTNPPINIKKIYSHTKLYPNKNTLENSQTPIELPSEN